MENRKIYTYKLASRKNSILAFSYKTKYAATNIEYHRYKIY